MSSHDWPPLHKPAEGLPKKFQAFSSALDAFSSALDAFSSALYAFSSALYAFSSALYAYRKTCRLVERRHTRSGLPRGRAESP